MIFLVFPKYFLKQVEFSNFFTVYKIAYSYLHFILNEHFCIPKNIY